MKSISDSPMISFISLITLFGDWLFQWVYYLILSVKWERLPYFLFTVVSLELSIVPDKLELLIQCLVIELINVKSLPWQELNKDKTHNTSTQLLCMCLSSCNFLGYCGDKFVSLIFYFFLCGGSHFQKGKFRLRSSFLNITQTQKQQICSLTPVFWSQNQCFFP